MLWITIGSLGALLLLVGLGRFLLSLRSEPGLGGLPATPLQKLAWVGMLASASVGAGLAVLVALKGATGLQEDATSRGVFWLLLLVGVGMWLVAWHRTNRSSGGPVVDERDRAILARSLSVESMVVLLSLVAWTVALTEIFWEDGTVPVAYLQLIFWSTFLGGIFGRSVGIILGYRREVGTGA